MGITMLVTTQGILMLFACCGVLNDSTIGVLVIITTVLLLWIGATLTIALSRKESERKQASESLRKELESIHRVISGSKRVAHHSNYVVEYTHKYLNHDIYDSLLTTGRILHIKYNAQQTLQDVIKVIKSHNEYFRLVEHLDIKGYAIDGLDGEDGNHKFAYQKIMQSYEDKIINDIQLLLGKL